MIKSPINYTGNKYKILPQLLNLFPKNIDTFIDLFSGSCTVGINIDCNKVVFNDINNNVYNIFKVFLNNNKDKITYSINEYIDIFKLNKQNQDGYYKAREYYNSNSLDLYDKSILLFVLVCHGFNNQIRFNSNNKFNIPFGERCFNEKTKENLDIFLDYLHGNVGKYNFSNKHFYEIVPDKNCFVFCDPPYLITQATYNSLWNITEEQKLYEYLDNLNSNRIRFGLTNISNYNEKENILLLDFMKSYKVFDLKNNFQNCSYRKSGKTTKTREVFICNY